MRSKIPLLVVMASALALGPAGSAFSGDRAVESRPLAKLEKKSQGAGSTKKVRKNQ